MRRVLVALGLLTLLTGCGSTSFTPPHTITASSVVAPQLITVPDVVGQNAAVAVDKLKKLGFTNVGLGTVDGRRVVILPENWTVKTQSARSGEQLTTDAKIVLGCARNG